MLHLHYALTFSRNKYKTRRSNREKNERTVAVYSHPTTIAEGTSVSSSRCSDRSEQPVAAWRCCADALADALLETRTHGQKQRAVPRIALRYSELRNYSLNYLIRLFLRKFAWTGKSRNGKKVKRPGAVVQQPGESENRVEGQEEDVDEHALLQITLSLIFQFSYRCFSLARKYAITSGHQ